MPTVTQSISNFLAARSTLTDKWSSNMETQKLAEGDGFNIRIPKQAKTQPNFHDYEMKWPLDLYATHIGATGWD